VVLTAGRASDVRRRVAVGIGATVLTINGVAPGNPVALNPLNTALENATAVLGTTIAPGQVVTYNFTFAPEPGRTDYSFTLNAVGNGGETSANPQDVDASLPCVDCASAHEIFVAPGATAPATLSGGWYNTPLTVRINASTTHASGLSAIAYQFLTGRVVRPAVGREHHPRCRKHGVHRPACGRRASARCVAGPLAATAPLKLGLSRSRWCSSSRLRTPPGGTSPRSAAATK
jgi:hypothetical protein